VLGVDSTESSLIVVGVEMLMMCAILPLGALSDRIGRKPLLITAAVGFMVFSLPAFKLMQRDSVVALAIGFAIVAGLLLLILAVIGSAFPAMFATRVRYCSFAIGYNISTLMFGGTAGYAVDWLIDLTGSNDVPAYYLMAAGAIALVPILRIPETSGLSMTQIEILTSRGTAQHALAETELDPVTAATTTKLPLISARAIPRRARSYSSGK
ncbi:MAG: MFS transporter, partial [Pseudonocardiaceae bacterium]